MTTLHDTNTLIIRSLIATTLFSASVLAGDDLPTAAAVREAGIHDVVHAYVTASGSGPQHVIRLDNNLELLLACHQPRTREQLAAAGLDIRESQVELLKTWRLLDERDDTLETSMPMLGEDATGRLRALSRAAAARLVERHETDFRRFNELLEERGWRESGFTLVFSLVLDGIIWDRFEAQSMVRPLALTTETPHWDGTCWLIYPNRQFVTGTNTISDEGVSMSTNWSPEAMPKMAALVSYSSLVKLFEEIVERPERHSPEIIEIFEPYGIVDGAGRLLVAQLEDNASDPIYTFASEFCTTLATNVIDLMADEELQTVIPRGDGSDRLVIFYHELMWDMLDELDRRGMIRIPPVLRGEGEQQQVGSLVFIVR